MFAHFYRVNGAHKLKSCGNSTKFKPRKNSSATYRFRLWSRRSAKIHA